MRARIILYTLVYTLWLVYKNVTFVSFQTTPSKIVPFHDNYWHSYPWGYLYLHSCNVPTSPERCLLCKIWKSYFFWIPIPYANKK